MVLGKSPEGEDSSGKGGSCASSCSLQPPQSGDLLQFQFCRLKHLEPSWVAPSLKLCDPRGQAVSPHVRGQGDGGQSWDRHCHPLELSPLDSGKKDKPPPGNKGRPPPVKNMNVGGKKSKMKNIRKVGIIEYPDRERTPRAQPVQPLHRSPKSHPGHPLGHCPNPLELLGMSLKSIPIPCHSSSIPWALLLSLSCPSGANQDWRPGEEWNPSKVQGES